MIRAMISNILMIHFCNREETRFSPAGEGDWKSAAEKKTDLKFLFMRRGLSSRQALRWDLAGRVTLRSTWAK